MQTDTFPMITSYFFERTRHDLMDEVIDEVLESENDTRKNLTDIEEEVLREQDKLLFEADDTMRRLFDNDFEAYWEALQDPDLMHERLKDHQRLIEEELRDQWEATQSDDGSGGHLQWGRDYENVDSASMPPKSIIVQEEDSQGIEEDQLYQDARSWAGEVHRLMAQLYYKEGRKDVDIFRAHTSAMIVPAKILWGGAILAMTEDGGVVLALRGYRLSLTFLERVLRALKAVKVKDFGVGNDVARQLRQAQQLRRELRQRITWLEKRIQ